VRHHWPDAYSAEQVLLNKRQIYGGAPKLHWYPHDQVTGWARPSDTKTNSRNTHATSRSITSGFRKYDNGSQRPVAQPAPYALTLFVDDIGKIVLSLHTQKNKKQKFSNNFRHDTWLPMEFSKTIMSFVKIRDNLDNYCYNVQVSERDVADFGSFASQRPIERTPEPVLLSLLNYALLGLALGDLGPKIQLEFSFLTSRHTLPA